MIRHGVAPFVECSSKGDKRFSAFHARLRSFGNRSIEDLYQSAKVFKDGRTGLDWREAKGKKAINPEEVSRLYFDLWCEYLQENQHLIQVILQASGLSDIYGQPGHNCQATTLWTIREQMIAASEDDRENQHEAPQVSLTDGKKSVSYNHKTDGRATKEHADVVGRRP